MIVLGVDGGGTKTEALAVSSSGEIFGRGFSGPSNINLVGEEVAKEELWKALNKALKNYHEPDIAVFGLAGAGRKKSREKYAKIVEELGLSNYVITTDGTIGLYAATLFKPGVLVSSGTGSIVMGLNERGDVARALGWGYLIDDEGSGFWIGRKILNIAFREYDGRLYDTGLTEIVLKWFKVRDLNELIEEIYSSRIPVTKIASLVKALRGFWRENPVARKVIEEAVAELSEAVKAVAEKLSLKPPLSVYYTGGVFKLDPLLPEMLKQYLEEKLAGEVRVLEASLRPVIG
ncbi:MAG TPA: hypothetical protein ENF87_02780, partial [Thermoproteales archaeon]|nr:hypothetical protein [Thermoproteales archaeon]